jgi:hypothetical protein
VHLVLLRDFLSGVDVLVEGDINLDFFFSADIGVSVAAFLFWVNGLFGDIL